MARRKQQWLDDDDSSGDSDPPGDDPDDAFDPGDPDLAAERELFRNPGGYGKKRNRDEAQEDATYGIWADEEVVNSGRGGAGGGARGRGRGGARGGRKTDYTRGPAFVSAGSKPSKAPPGPIDNLATSLQVEDAQSDDNDDGEAEMDLGSDQDSSNDDLPLDPADDDGDSDDLMDDDDDSNLPDDSADLAPVPGLAPSPPPPAPAEPTLAFSGSSLGFAPRGLGARARGGGSGSSGAGIGARPGIGGGSAATPGAGLAVGSSGMGGIGLRGGIGSASSGGGIGSRPPAFASATAASDVPLGGSGSRAANDAASRISAFSSPNLQAASTSSGAASPMAGAATPHAGLGDVHRPPPNLVDQLRAQLNSNPSPTINETTGIEPTTYTDSAPTPAPAPRRSFLPSAASAAPGPKAPAPKISAKEEQHFAKLAQSRSVGMRMLEKMGWKSGTGLGAEGQGIVTPIGEGQKLRRKGAGIAQGERTAGSLAEEARRLGKDPDEVEKAGRGGRKGPKQLAAAPKAPAKDAWTQPKRAARPKTEYKTYEEIVAETGAQDDGVGILVDLAGNALASQSLSALPAYGAGSADPTRLPELRHNLTLLTSTLSASLAHMAREGKDVLEKRRNLAQEEARVREAVGRQEEATARLERVLTAVGRVREIEREMVGLLSAGGADELGAEVFLRPFDDEFDNLYVEGEYQGMGLDEVVVGAIAPILRRLFAQWDPLAQPTLAVAELKRWRKLFLIDKHQPPPTDQMDIDVYGSASSGPASRAHDADRSMTPYETLMWTIWLPKVRSAINNHWSPADPHPAVALYTTWAPLLPAFLRDNVLDQLVLPKVTKAIAEWSPSALRRGGPALHTIVFPWLEHAGPRMEVVLDEATRKVRAWLKGWKARDGVPRGVDVWRDAIPPAEWDALVLRHVLPQLGARLREAFVVDPKAQELGPLEDALAWAPLLRSAMLSQLLEAAFFPKWLDALYAWLASGEANLEEVAAWYSWWKGYLPEAVVALSGVNRGFRKGLDLMNQAMALGDDVKYRLRRPDTAVPVSGSGSGSGSREHRRHRAPATPAAPAPAEEVSFRQVVEEVAAASNLVFLATGKADGKGHQLFRVSKGVDGKSGVTVYLEDDVVWLQEEGEWVPVGVEEMCRRAGRS